MIKAKIAVLAGCFASAATFDAVAENSLKSEVVRANTPQTPIEWMVPGNWSQERIPADGEATTFPSYQYSYYVHLPENIKSGKLSCGWNTYLVGECITMTSASTGNTKQLDKGWFFADVHVADAGSLVAEKDCWFDSATIAGRIFADGRHIVPSSGTLKHQLDRYATSPNPLRTDDVVITQPSSGGVVGIKPGNASYAVYAAGADASSSAWHLTDKSPYIQCAEPSAAFVAVGATVTGAGIPPGTYVRRRFTESMNWLELSNPVTETIPSNVLSFGSFNPDVRYHVPWYGPQGSNGSSLMACRRLLADSVRFEIDVFTMSTQDHYWKLGVPSNESTWIPGTFVLHEVTGGSADYINDRLLNCHLEFAGMEDGSPTRFPATRRMTFVDAQCTARMTVPEEKTGIIESFTGFTGTLVKDGAGALKIGLEDAANAGALVVKDGVLELVRADSAAWTGTSFGSISIAAGATLKIPLEGLTVGELSIEDGATIVGPGRLVVEGRRSGSPVLENGAVIEYQSGARDASVFDPEAKVAGHPAFWVDASRTDTMQLVDEGNGVYTVSRWNDCRADEPMFCTNVVRRPRLFAGNAMQDKYVKIEFVNTTWYTNTQGLVWSVPIGGIKAVFLVQDPTDGGGEVLGATSRLPHGSYFGSQGGPYYRSTNGNWSDPIIMADYATECVKYGRFFIDGVEICGYEKGYSGDHIQLLEHHVSQNHLAKQGQPDLFCDAFGTGGYLDGHQYNFANGRQRISEVIIYTNALTHAERVETALYLSRKWLGHDIYYSNVDEKATEESMTMVDGEVLNVAGDKTLGIRRVEGGSDLGKSGEGLVVVDSLVGGNVRVDQGSLLVKSFSYDNERVPAGALVHVDASDASSLDVSVSGTTTNLVKWHSRGTQDDSTLRPLEGSPRVIPNALNGLPVVDCGVLDGEGKSSMRLYKADGTQYQHVNNSDPGPGLAAYMEITPFRAVFTVFGSKGGGNSLLGGCYYGHPFQGLIYSQSAPGKPMFAANTYESQKGSGGYNYQAWSADEQSAVQNGVCRLNGVQFDPFSTPFSGGYDLLTLQFSKNLRRGSDCFAEYGSWTGADAHVGGLEYGEMLIYTNELYQAQVDATEAYLRKKWFNQDTAGFRSASCNSLIVASGANVTVADWSPRSGANNSAAGAGELATAELGGGGAIAGELTVLANGKILAVVNADGRGFETLTVTGSIDLSRGAAVEIVGSADSLPAGDYAILSCEGLRADAVGELNAPSATKRRSFSVRAVDSAIIISVRRKGLILSVR